MCVPSDSSFSFCCQLDTPVCLSVLLRVSTEVRPVWGTVLPHLGPFWLVLFVECECGPSSTYLGRALLQDLVHPERVTRPLTPPLAGDRCSGSATSLPPFSIFVFDTSVMSAFSFTPLSSSHFTSRNMAIWFLTKLERQFNGEREVCLMNGFNWSSMCKNEPGPTL